MTMLREVIKRAMANAAKSRDVMELGHVPKDTHANWVQRVDPKTGEIDLVNMSGPTGHAFTDLKNTATPDTVPVSVINDPQIAHPPIDMAKLQRDKAEFVFGPTDRARGGGELSSSGSTVFENPVPQEGGINFTQMHKDVPIPGMPADVAPLYASVSKAAASGANNRAFEVLERGGQPWYVPIIMGPNALNSSQQMTQSVLQAMRQAQPSADAIAMFDKAVLTQLPKKAKELRASYPGFGSDKLDEWLDANLTGRMAFTQAGDSKRVLNATGVDVSALRFANTDPRLTSTPSGSAGIVMGRMRPDVGITEHPLHSNYPITFMGQRGEIGGAPGNIPFSLLAPDMHRGLTPVQYKPGVSAATTPASQVMRGLPSHVPSTQPVTQEVVDNWYEWFRRNPQGWAVPAAAGGMGSAFAADRYEAPPPEKVY